MLHELRIENLLLIERAELAFDAGLNAITGETGAGKTVLAHAIDLLLGGKSRRGIVRPGASEAYVEGLFGVPRGLLDQPCFDELRERLPDPDAHELALARRVSPEGRTRAYIEGRAATAADLRALAGALVAFYGQHEHRKLTLAGAQLAALDDFVAAADAKHRARLAELAGLHAEAACLHARLTELELVDGRRERELGLIEFELAEIEELAPDAAEEDELRAEHGRLQAVDGLRAAAAGALGALDDEATGGAQALVAAAAAQLQPATGVDAALAALAARIAALALELQDTVGELRAYGDGLAADPERLALLDERLAAYERLKRKHGGTIETVLEHAARCRDDRARLSGSREQIAETAARLATVEARQHELAGRAGRARRKAAPQLAEAVKQRLAQLALADASFAIEIVEAAQAGPWGADAVEFLIAPNPGIAAAPLRESASGGELSRVMLALLTASGAGTDQTFVFDEIDAGIGGHTARAVGEQLRALGLDRQVICITHLPQVAAAAARHFRIVKAAGREQTEACVEQLGDRAVVDELCRMLGAGAGDTGARQHARRLLAAA